MSMSLNEIKKLSSVDLDKFEIRGAKYGINNARTTGTVYVDGDYIPASNKLQAFGTFTASDTTVRGIGFYPPYSYFNATRFLAGDTIQFDNTSFSISGVVDSTSVALTKAPDFSTTKDFTAVWGFREYLIEPDVGKNTVTGNAIFTKDSTVVNGVGTAWSSQLAVGDYFKSDSYQKNYIISAPAPSDTTVNLNEKYGSSSSAGPEAYTAKRRQLGRMYVEYVKDDFHYEKNGGVWVKNDGTSGSFIAQKYFTPLADGIKIKFSPALSPADPDMMDTAVVLEKVFAQKTQREMFQFPLPVVPYPESSLKLYINDIEQDMFPNGNRNYVVNYHQDPVYIPPPAPADRRVANLMFLQSTGVQTLEPSETAVGIINFVDASGNSYNGIMPSSETIWFDGTNKTRNIDYVFDGNSGIAYATITRLNENIVGPIFVDCSDLIDYGIEFTLNGIKQKYSVPPKPTDNVLISLESGRFKPADKDHPGAEEEYLIRYQVDSEYVNKEYVPVYAGMTSFRTKKFPVKANSVVLSKNGVVLEEATDFRVDYQSGRVVLFSALSETDQVLINYAPLSVQLNGMSYDNGVSYCTSYGTQLTIRSVSGMSFSLANSNLKPSDSTFLKIFNVTKNKDYDVTGIISDSDTLTLAKSPANVAIGLADTDVVIADYRFASEETEYSPIIINDYTVFGKSSTLYIPTTDATSFFISGSVVRLIPSDGGTLYHFIVTGSQFDGEDTEVKFSSTVPEDIINPSILVSDSSVSFYAVGMSGNVTSGSNTITLPSLNIPNLFRAGSLVKIGPDVYEVGNAVFADGATTVTLTSGVFTDYLPSMVYLSETPVYIEGSTTITPAYPIITEPAQPGILLNYWAGTPAYVTTTSTTLNFITDTSTFSYNYIDRPTLNDLSSGLSSIPGLSALVYQPAWQSSKFTPVSNMFVGMDSSTLLTVQPALRINGTDSVDFTITDGEIILTNGLTKGQKINLDYQGLKYIADTTVSFLANYFTNLPANSKVSASFQFNNLDQFYVQVVSRRWFLENVTQPRVKQEAQQQSGSVGQGGEVPDDADQGNMDGGLTNDEYRRQDTQIECNIFTAIFDFFNNRAKAMGDEMYAGTGWRLCNNDGLLSKNDQSAAIKAFNRMWPTSDYTNLEPLKISPLTGTIYAPGRATFTLGHPGVTGINTKWSLQAKAGDYIRVFDSTRQYKITSVGSDTTISLQTAFQEPTRNNVSFALSSNYPLFDDDGNMGAKISGTMSEPFNLSTGDDFTCTLDGTQFSYTFSSPAYIGMDIAGRLTTGIPGLKASYEQIFDPSTPYGIKNALVLRTDGTLNCLGIVDGSAVVKMGLEKNTVACGNINRTVSGAEVWMDKSEASMLDQERTRLNSLINYTWPGAVVGFKLDRTTAIPISYVYEIANLIRSESTAISLEEQKLTNQATALSTILQEPSLPSYSNSLTALSKVISAQSDGSNAYIYDQSILTNWEGRIDASKWVLDYTSCRQDIRYKNPITNVGYDTTGPGLIDIVGQTSFTLQVPPIHDPRILNYLSDVPVAMYVSGGAVPGSWSGWQAGAPVFNRYSIRNDATFTGGPFTGPLYVLYKQISDDKLGDRTDFITDRSSALNSRVNYLLNIREPEIFSNVKTESFFNTDGDTGNLYLWANNRFNRRQGCDARLVQVQKLIEANQSGLEVNKSLM